MEENILKKVLTKPFIGYNIIIDVSTLGLRVLTPKGGVQNDR